jgi:hypothetical protein
LIDERPRRHAPFLTQSLARTDVVALAHPGIESRDATSQRRASSVV